MSKSSFLILVYSENIRFNRTGKALEIVHAFTESMMISDEELVQFFDGNFKNEFSIKDFPGFDSLDVLNKVAFKFCDAFQKECVTLISTSQLNSVIDKHESKAELLNAVVDIGNQIKNLDLLEKKKNLFNRILGN